MGDTAVKPQFRKGGEAAKDESASSGSNFAKTHFLSIDEDSHVFLRYLTDEPDWLYCLQHASVPTKNKPAGYEGNWPEAMPAVCRYDKAFEGIYHDCYIDDAKIQNKWGKPNKATIRNWALACLREEVVATEEMVGQSLADGREITADMVGKRIGFKDQTRKVAITDAEGKPTGEEKEERAIVVVNMAPSNYFNALQAIYATYKAIDGDDATICDRDFAVRKSGKEKDTVYSHIEVARTPDFRPGTEKWKRYDEAVAEQGLDLGSIMADRASDEYFARFFDPTKSVPSTSSGGGSSEKPEVPAAASNEPDPDRLAAMRERVRSQSAQVVEVD